MNNDMRDYIDRCNEQVFLPPFVATIADFFGFAVRANHKILNERICDRFLNIPLNVQGRFTALQYVIFVFNTVTDARSEDYHYKDRGTFSYQEAAVWMLVADNKRRKLHWFQPYIFVDDPYAMLAGREIYGFPKTLGSFHIPNGPNPPDRLWVKAPVVKAPEGMGSHALLFEVGRPPGSTNTCSECSEEEDFFMQVLGNLNVTVEYFRGFGFEEDLAKSFYDDLRKMELPMIFLKQFRYGVNPAQAEGAGVQEAKSQITKFRGGRIYGGGRIYDSSYEIAINDVYSHQIREFLGLDKGQLPIDLAFWMSLDFRLGRCTLIPE